MDLPIGFNQARRFVTNLTDAEAHRVKLCVVKKMDETEDRGLFHSILTPGEYCVQYKDDHAPDVDESVWKYHDTFSALFDEWIERDDMWIVVCGDDFTCMLEDCEDIYKGSAAWVQVMRTILRTRMWKGRHVRLAIAYVDTVWA